MLSGTYAENAVLDAFGHLIYHAGAWWLLITLIGFLDLVV